LSATLPEQPRAFKKAKAFVQKKKKQYGALVDNSFPVPVLGQRRAFVLAKKFE